MRWIPTFALSRQIIVVVIPRSTRVDLLHGRVVLGRYTLVLFVPRRRVPCTSWPIYPCVVRFASYPCVVHFASSRALHRVLGRRRVPCTSWPMIYPCVVCFASSCICIVLQRQRFDVQCVWWRRPPSPFAIAPVVAGLLLLLLLRLSGCVWWMSCCGFVVLWPTKPQPIRSIRIRPRASTRIPLLCRPRAIMPATASSPLCHSCWARHAVVCAVPPVPLYHGHCTPHLLLCCLCWLHRPVALASFCSGGGNRYVLLILSPIAAGRGTPSALSAAPYNGNCTRPRRFHHVPCTSCWSVPCTSCWSDPSPLSPYCRSLSSVLSWDIDPLLYDRSNLTISFILCYCSSSLRGGGSGGTPRTRACTIMAPQISPLTKKFLLNLHRILDEEENHLLVWVSDSKWIITDKRDFVNNHVQRLFGLSKGELFYRKLRGCGFDVEAKRGTGTGDEYQTVKVQCPEHFRRHQHDLCSQIRSAPQTQTHLVCESDRTNQALYLPMLCVPWPRREPSCLVCRPDVQRLQ